MRCAPYLARVPGRHGEAVNGGDSLPYEPPDSRPTNDGISPAATTVRKALLGRTILQTHSSLGDEIHGTRR